MSYPARHDFYGFANRVIQNTARRENAPLVDLARLFAPRCPEPRCPELLFEDGHPKAAGYRVIAEVLVQEIARRYGR